jgi:group I intron endonuclease
MIGIYKITSPNGKVYIGQSKDLHRREGDYKRYSKKSCRQVKLLASIHKYGWDNHLFEIIEECSIETLSTRERFWQEYYNSVIDGLNCILTKTDFKVASFGAESRKKMSDARKGKKHTENTKKKMSLIKQGKIFSDESKAKISKALKGKSKIMSEEWKKAIADANQNRNSIKISCINPDGKLFYFNSFKEASQVIGVTPQAIQNVVRQIKNKKGCCKGWCSFKIVKQKNK